MSASDPILLNTCLILRFGDRRVPLPLPPRLELDNKRLLHLKKGRTYR